MAQGIGSLKTYIYHAELSLFGNTMVEIILTEPLWVATFILVGIVLLKYTGYKDRLGKSLGFAVASVLFMYLSAVTGMGFWNRPELLGAQEALTIIWQVIAWILLLVSAFLAASDLAKVK